jgi:lipopolysaccharide biosynthesis glycosyltransferase
MHNEIFPIYIGWDSREPIAYEVCKYSILRNTRQLLKIKPLKERELRKHGFFIRPWLIDGKTGNKIDLIDGKPFSTEFSHTRFLVPHLRNHKGWALFMDSDMIFTTDIKELLNQRNDKYAVMVVKHNHRPKELDKMDDQPQQAYHRKNWSSFVLWNCGHPSNAKITAERVNTYSGGELHAFSWLKDSEIGSLDSTWNWIEGISPMPPEYTTFARTKKRPTPNVIHYTLGGPWFENCQDVMYAEEWTQEYERWQRNGGGKYITNVPSALYD